MLVGPGGLVISPSDVTRAVACEFGWLRDLDVALGRAAAGSLAVDAMGERTAALGLAHERRALDRFLARFGEYDEASGSGVLRLDRPRSAAADRLADAARRTTAALRGGADVLYQAAFSRPGFHGVADFLVRGPDGRWVVHDSKLARHATVSALLQIAAYADELERLEVPVAAEGVLLLGDGSTVARPLADIVPVYRARHARAEAIGRERMAGADPVEWADPRYRACGRCEVCGPEVERHRDLLLVAGMRATQRERLLAAGIGTIDDLAGASGDVPGIPAATLATLTAQARLQVRGDRDGPVLYELFHPGGLAALPPPSAGDIFFDFEGDPLWSDGDLAQSGLEYLFGVVEAPPGGAGPADSAALVFRPFWAHDRRQERQALLDFLEYVARRRAAHPDMHIYHYAPYERTALLRLAGRYGVGEDQVDDLLRHDVLVDLYAVVRQTMRISQGSYSIKRLEPLYMGDELRSGDVTTAGDSIVEYARYCDLRDAGDTDRARATLAAIADYNRYDCMSTLRLRDWLLMRAGDHQVEIRRGGAPDPVPSAPDPAASEPDAAGDAAGDAAVDAEADLVRRLTADLASVAPADRSADQRARALLAASLGYHQREDKPFWWAHFDRLQQPIDEWADTTEVLVVDAATVLADWAMTGRQRSPHRTLAIRGVTGGGIDVPSEVVALYEPGRMPPGVTAPPGYRGYTRAAVIRRDDDDPGIVDIDERIASSAPPGAEPTDPAAAGRDPGGRAALPVALAPGSVVPTEHLHDAIVEVASAVADSASRPGSEPDVGTAIADLLRRRPPRLRGGRTVPHDDPGERSGGPIGPEDLARIVADLDGSYLAVQGPPGSGKTHTGARVVARLLRLGWSIGVVAQSHRVVENFLDAVHLAGVPAERIGKREAHPRRADGSDGRSTATPPTRTPLGSAGRMRGWLAEHGRDAGTAAGCVIGGTAWDFANPQRIARGGLDLLVIDEAGQFSLANTIAVSVAATNLLLLGDPQQLPQVSQGTHPEPCDGSALGWIMDGHAVLPAERGYFLSRSWRMHPAVCEPVSRLSYDGRLAAQREVTAARHLDGVPPGIAVIDVAHAGNATSSPEEADEVVRQVRDLIGRTWTAPDEHPAPRPLGQQDILVVAPYNAQVACVRRALAADGFDAIRVGTVDRFQGQQAPVVIVSMTASSAADVPRGMDFLLNRNRLNVAVSRAQWCALLVRSATLADHLPTSPEGLAELGAFLRLCAP